MLRSTLLVAVFAIGLTAFAEHFPGGTVSFRCLGGNQYEFNLLAWRNCSGVAMVPQQLRFRNDCGFEFSFDSLQPTSVTEVSPLCAAELPFSTCNGGPLIGLEAYTYSVVVPLMNCANWIVSWDICCRNPSLNLVGTPGIYVETRFNTENVPCNNSPVFTDLGVPFACVGEPLSYAVPVTETDGHILRYSLIEAQFYNNPGGYPVEYVFPHYGASPWTGMAIDSITGVITFTPDQIGFITTAVQVDEYDASGNWLCSIMRDFPFITGVCDNTPPSPTAGTISSTTGAAGVLGNYEWQACDQGMVCMQAEYTDPDAGQALTFTSDVTSVLPGATLQSSGTNPATLNVCWDATGAVPGTRLFTVTVSDGGCPIVGSRTFSYALQIIAPTAGGNGAVLTCELAPPVILFDSLPGAPVLGGSWTYPDGSAHDGVLDPANDPPGDYAYTITAFAGCSASATVSVSYLPDDDPMCETIGWGERDRQRLVLHPNPASSELWLSGLDDEGPISMQLCDAQGRLIATPVGRTSGTTIHLPLTGTLAGGSYYLRVFLRDGGLRVLPFQLLR